MSDNSKVQAKHSKRLLKLLSKYGARGLAIVCADNKIQVQSTSRTYTFENEILVALSKQNHVKLSTARVAITQLGLAALKYVLEPELGDSVPDRQLRPITVKQNDCSHSVLQNVNESPLDRLYQRKTKTGSPYISSAEFEAGERIRRDFERGQLQPKISASLQGAMGSAGKGAGNSSAEISDFAMDSRKRVGEAVEKLGPELSGIILDICCFLKGFELVERERKWPPRSAKLMLKTGLSVLARHYGLAGQGNSGFAKTRVWSAKDYRPEIA